MSDAVGYHDELARGWEARYKKRSFQRREHVLDSCLEGLDLRGQRWLDAGCGTARLGRALARRGARLVGIDGSAEMIRIARDEAAREQFPFPSQFEQLKVEEIETLGTCDGILCNSVVEYLDDPKAFITSCARSLRDGGLLLVSAPNRGSIVRRVLARTFAMSRAVTGRGWPRYLSYSKNEYFGDDFASLLESHGLRVQKRVYFGGPVPLSLQSLPSVGPLCMFVAKKA